MILKKMVKRNIFISKKGQFYIIAAVIIIVTLSGLVAIVNYAKTRPEPIKFYDLSEQFYGEASKVVDYGVINNADVQSKLDNFTKTFLKYSNSKEPNINFVFVYGNSSSLTVFQSNQSKEGSESRITLNTGSTQSVKIIPEDNLDISKTVYTPTQDTIALNFSGAVYNFNLTGGQQFFVVLRLEKANETYYSRDGG